MGECVTAYVLHSWSEQIRELSSHVVRRATDCCLLEEAECKCGGGITAVRVGLRGVLAFRV